MGRPITSEYTAVFCPLEYLSLHLPSGHFDQKGMTDFCVPREGE